MPKHFPDSHFLDLYKRYAAGESTVDIQRSTGIYRLTLKLRWRKLGFELRSQSEARLLEAQRVGPVERKRRCAAANRAKRGSHPSFNTLCKSAITREAKQLGVSHLEKRLCRELTNMQIRPQAAIGPYNADLLVNNSIDVEINGGNWHVSDGRYTARHQKRTRYILNHGFHVMVCWIYNTHKVNWRSYAKHVIALNELSRINPAMARQYWVIEGNGKLLTVLNEHVRHLPL